MSQPANTPPLAVTRLLERTCVRCGKEPAVEKRTIGQACLDAKRTANKAYMRRIRAERRRAKQCVDCGKKCKKRRCPDCWRASRGGGANAEGVEQKDGIWRADPGTNWMRFRGKGRRGRLTREEQIDEDIRDAGFAIEELRKFVEKAAILKRPDVMNLPSIQRDAARREVGQHLGFAGRIVDDLSDRYR